MKNINLLFALLCANLLIAQTTRNDSIVTIANKKIQAEYPSQRLLNIDYRNSFAREINSKLFKKEYNEGKIKYQESINVSANVPVYKYKKWLLSVTGNYSSYTISSQTKQFGNEEIQNISNFHYYDFGLNSRFFGKFKKN